MSEDPFYCGETFEAELNTRERIWRFRTEEEMIQAHGENWRRTILKCSYTRKKPNGDSYHWTEIMNGLLGKPLSEFTFVRRNGHLFDLIDFNPAEDRSMARLRNTLGSGPVTWMVSPKDDFIYDYPV